MILIALAIVVVLFFIYLILWRHSYVNACRIYLMTPPEASGRFAVVLGIRPAVCAELPLRKEPFASKMRAVHFESRLIPTYSFADVGKVMKPV